LQKLSNPFLIRLSGTTSLYLRPQPDRTRLRLAGVGVKTHAVSSASNQKSECPTRIHGVGIWRSHAFAERLETYDLRLRALTHVLSETGKCSSIASRLTQIKRFFRATLAADVDRNAMKCYQRWQEEIPRRLLRVIE
jgi:hypothetical protein